MINQLCHTPATPPLSYRPLTGMPAAYYACLTGMPAAYYACLTGMPAAYYAFCGTHPCCTTVYTQLSAVPYSFCARPDVTTKDVMVDTGLLNNLPCLPGSRSPRQLLKSWHMVCCGPVRGGGRDSRAGVLHSLSYRLPTRTQ